ncbi:MAG: divergent PAP2 family protein [Oscillospiraceae bacterium]|nr:divergent PAP2 family protein [Oscillospiraceae bacterium]
MPSVVYNYILTAAVVSWLAAQVIKTALYYIINKKFRVERLFGAGGMPSAHSAMVCSATIAIASKCGADSPEFALIFIFAAIVMYDAMGVRRAAGFHAKEINRMNKMFSLKEFFAPDDDESEATTVEQEIKELKEYLGHTPLEVLSGAILGIIIAFVLPH